MGTAKDTLDRYFLEMRWRCLSLAADLDRIERASGGSELMKSDPRLMQLRQAIDILNEGPTTRAERVQMIFSDMSPPPKR
jgi:hypothetical protein